MASYSWAAQNYLNAHDGGIRAVHSRLIIARLAREHELRQHLERGGVVLEQCGKPTYWLAAGAHCRYGETVERGYTGRGPADLARHLTAREYGLGIWNVVLPSW